MANFLKLNFESLLDSEVSIQKDRIKFRINCKHGVEKLHEMQYEEIVNVRAVYDTSECMNSWTTNPKVLLDILSNFPSHIINISFVFSAKSFQLRTVNEIHSIDPENSDRGLETLITVDLDDFETYNISFPCTITFNVKEFKKVLVFGESISSSVVALFSTPGNPFVFQYSPNLHSSVDFVLATFQDQLGKTSSQISFNPSQEPIILQQNTTPKLPKRTSPIKYSEVIENQKNIERTGFTSPQRLPKTLFQSLTDLNSQDVEINFSDDEHIILPTQKKHKV